MIFNKLSALALFGGICLSMGCGMIDMPNKMDQTNQNMNDMKSKMDTTNGKMDKTNQNMSVTNNAIHKQTLMVALDHMLSKENTQYFSPVPAGMMPWEQAFADEMHEDEFVKLVYLYVKDINEVGPDDSLKVNGQWPVDLAKSVDHEKTAKLYAILGISGFASQEMIGQVVDTEITNGGEFSSTAYQILAARTLFIHEILLKETLLSYPLNDPGTLQRAVERAHYLDYVTELPYLAKVELKTYGMLDTNDNQDIKASDFSAVDTWAKIDQAFDTQLDQQYKDQMKSATPTGQQLVNLRQEVRSACKNIGHFNGKACTP